MPDAPASVLRMVDVSKVYLGGEKPFLALDKVNVDIGEGELISILGPSGSGKSTLLHMLGCLDLPSSGEIYLGGKNDFPRAGFICPEDFSFKNCSVLEHKFSCHM